MMFVLPRMVMGGVERVTLNLIAQFQSEGIDCTLALGRCYGEMLDEAERITAVHEIAGKGVYQFVPRLAALIREWQPTHIIVVFSDVCLLTLWARNWAHSSAAVVCGVHNSHGRETTRSGFWGRVRHMIDNHISAMIYRRVEAVVADSFGVEMEITESFRFPMNRVRTIYNPVLTAQDAAMIANRTANTRSPILRIVSIGRLARQKGFDILIDAMKALEDRSDWRLDIYGDGPDRGDLEMQIEHQKLSDRVRLMGYTKDPINCLLDADVFVLSSRHEGLPTVLVLAVACGTQVVSTDCPHGPREILDNGAFGVLVHTEDSSALAEGINRVLSGQYRFDPAMLRKRAQDFTVESSAARWRSLLVEITAEASS